MNTIDYSLLKGRIILFGCVFLICILLLWLSFSQLSKQQRIMENSRATMDSAEEEISQLNNLISLFEHFNNDYKKYESKGFLSEEKRLSWIETLEKTASQLQLDNLRYDITPRKILTDEKKGIPPNISLFESKLSFESRLIHEGDLITLIANLDQLNSGLFIVDNCNVQRTSTGEISASSSNFQAKCDTLWYTAEYKDTSNNDFIEDEL